MNNQIQTHTDTENQHPETPAWDFQIRWWFPFLVFFGTLFLCYGFVALTVWAGLTVSPFPLFPSFDSFK